VTPAYTAADCLAHPTLEDTFAMAVLEAMAHGLPVLVSTERYCGIAGDLQDGHNALILNDPRDAEALAQCVEHLFRVPGLCQSMREQALLFAGQHRWTDVAAQQEAIYYSVVDGSLPSCKPKR
jgi:UDP-glucose:(heptosyl)LPS alpha-1,3-glucosyltransferase